MLPACQGQVLTSLEKNYASLSKILENEKFVMDRRVMCFVDLLQWIHDSNLTFNVLLNQFTELTRVAFCYNKILLSFFPSFLGEDKKAKMLYKNWANDETWQPADGP